MVITLQAYFDSSGKVNDPNTHFLTLAGYIGIPDAWLQFAESWNRILKRFGHPYLHMREKSPLLLIQDLFNECFSPTGWEDFKDKFYGASCTVNLEDYRKICNEMPSCSFKEPEAICVDFVITIALMALPENRNLPYGKEGQIEVIFDQGEPFMEKVVRIWQAEYKSELKSPLKLIRNIETADMRNTVGLQAADFLAWLTNRYYTHGFKEPTGVFAGITRVLAAPLCSQYCDYDYFMNIKKHQNGVKP
jgi:hypothetical protein